MREPSSEFPQEGVDFSSDTGGDGDVDDYVRGGKTHFDEKDCGNQSRGHVSAAEMLKVKLLPSRRVPMQQQLFNGELRCGYF